VVAGWSFFRQTPQMFCQPATDGERLSYAAETLVFVLAVRGNISAPSIRSGLSWGGQSAAALRQTVAVSMVSVPSQ
jgi:hypothetical protein